MTLTIGTTGSPISFISRLECTCVGPNGIATYCIDTWHLSELLEHSFRSKENWNTTDWKCLIKVDAEEAQKYNDGSVFTIFSLQDPLQKKNYENIWIWYPSYSLYFICFMTLFDVIGINKLRILLIVSQLCELWDQFLFAFWQWRIVMRQGIHTVCFLMTFSASVQ